MKKFIAILAISCTSLLLTGCFGGDEVETEIDSSYNMQSFVGTVGVNESSLNATHILEADTGETVYLRSDLFDLSEYEGGKLRVTGVAEVTDGGETILLVESRDVLEEGSLSSEPFLFEFEDKGFEIEIPEDKYEISESSSLVNFVAETHSFSVRSIQKGLELDLEIYLDENYGDQIPQDVQSANGDRYSRLNLAAGRSVYIHNTPGVIYEIIFNSDGSNNAEMNLEINNIIDNIYFNPEDITEEVTNELSDIDESEPAEDTTNDSNEDGTTDDEITVSEPVDLSGLSGEVTNIVNAVNSNKSALLGSDVEIFNYSITDNNYVYVSYTDSDEAEFRKLFKINGSSLEEVAYFEEGTSTDWELVSGDNLAYDRPMKMVFVESDGYRQVDVKEGYRYFESRPMSLGFHYPRQWYYAGGSNIYRFAKDPLPEGETLVTIEAVDDDFDSVSGTSVSSNIKRSTSGDEIIYYVEVNDGDLVKISGGNDYSEELNIMAQTMVEIDL